MRWTNYNGNKYKNQKTTVEGREFDSRKEARRFSELRILEKAGEISDLKCQVPFELIPEQREASEEIYTKGAHKGEKKPGKLIEKKVQYIADFVYTENGERIVEDTKGIRTKDYIIKRKLMLYKYGIRIREI